MIGQEVAKTYLTNSINQIDLTKLPKGLYNLSIFNRLEKFDEKIILNNIIKKKKRRAEYFIPLFFFILVLKIYS